MIASEPLPHFVDALLGYLHETHPTYATLDGVHAYDDHLEDLSRHAIESEVHALTGYLRRLDEITQDALTPVERLEHRMLTDHLRSRVFELEVVRTWERSPQFCSDILAASQDVGVKLRAPLPGPHHFELEHARPQVVGEHAVLEAFHRRERVLGDFVEPAEISGQGVNFTLDRVPAQILE